MRFWEDIWFGTAHLVVQLWDLYNICNQVGVSLATMWDTSEMKLIFRRNFSQQMFSGWLELVEIVLGVEYNDGGDYLVWHYDNKGTYTSRSLYAIINFRAIIPMYIPAVWRVKVPLESKFSCGFCHITS